MTQSPKKRFMMNTAAAAQHIGLVNSSAFINAMDMAMLEFITKLPDEENSEAAANFYRLEGAKAFRSIFENLGEIPIIKQPQASMPSSLNTEA